jgi:hypothetical protein
MNPAALGASNRCTRRCASDSPASLHGVSSLKITTGTRRGIAHASTRMVAGPYSQLTTQSGRARANARPIPRAMVIGLRPGRARCHESRISLP